MRVFTKLGWQYDTVSKSFYRRRGVPVICRALGVAKQIVGGVIQQGRGGRGNTRSQRGCFKPCYLKKAVQWMRKHQALTRHIRKVTLL